MLMTDANNKEKGKCSKYGECLANILVKSDNEQGSVDIMKGSVDIMKGSVMW